MDDVRCATERLWFRPELTEDNILMIPSSWSWLPYSAKARRGRGHVAIGEEMLRERASGYAPATLRPQDVGVSVSIAGGDVECTKAIARQIQAEVVMRLGNTRMCRV